jgi:RNA polymerase sigma-70 factor (ECF subfamily)
MDAAETVPLRYSKGATAIAFEERFAALRPRLVALCTSLVGPLDAQDVVQDVYVIGRSRVSQLRDPESLEAWLARIAVNRCYEYHRSRRHIRVAEIADVASQHESRDLLLRELIEQLPPRERTVLVLHYGHGYRLEEIGAMLSLSHTNVRSIIARTRKRLYRQLIEDQR